MAYLVFRQLLVMMVLVFVSFLVAKAGRFGKSESQFVSYLLLYAITPAMMIDTYNVPFDPVRLKYFLIMLALSVSAFLVYILCSTALGRAKSPEDDRRLAVDKMAMVYSNAGYIGIPIVKAVMGDGAVFYLMVYILTFNLMLWTHGLFLMTRRFSVKAVLTKPTVIAVVFAFLLFLCPFQLPSVPAQVADMLAEMNTPLSMVVFGIVFAGFRRPDRSHAVPVARLVRVAVLRLLVVPALTLFVLWLLHGFWAGDEAMRMLSLLLVITSASPIGLVATNFSLLYDKDAEYASLAVALTTALCVVTLPLWVSLAEHALAA